MLPDLDPYIVIAQQEWQLKLGTNARDLALELSKTRPVLYVNPAIDIKSSVTEIRSRHGRRRLTTALGFEKSIVKAGENLWVHTPATVGISINWLKNEQAFNMMNRLNAKRFYRSVRNAIARLGWKESECTILNDSQMFTGKHQKDFFNAKNSFYYIRDNLVYQSYFARHGTKAEPETISKADAVFANSAYLAGYAHQYNRNSLDIGQGCELDMYTAATGLPEPVDFKNIPHPRIGYTGYLTAQRLDIKLLEAIAAAKPGWHLVLIGPEDEQFRQSSLHDCKNVHFLGARSPELLPQYIQHFDVCMNPQIVNGLTIGNYPRKIDEYLAMGKPTIATDTPTMKIFLPHVILATGLDEYIAGIESALQPRDQRFAETARAFARSHTWAACVEKIIKTQKELSRAEII